VPRALSGLAFVSVIEEVNLQQHTRGATSEQVLVGIGSFGD
jgi:hypothetical protein